MSRVLTSLAGVCNARIPRERSSCILTPKYGPHSPARLLSITCLSYGPLPRWWKESLFGQADACPRERDEDLAKYFPQRQTSEVQSPRSRFVQPGNADNAE